MAVADYSTTPSSNTSISGLAVSDSTAVDSVDDIIRQLMADIKVFYDAAQPLDAGLTSISGLTTAADKMIYTTAADTYAVADLTAAGRALLDDADAAAQRTTLGLGNVDNTADADKPVSTATQAAIDALFSSVNIVTGSRSSGVNYTNSTGKPMFVTVEMNTSGTQTLSVDGTTVAAVDPGGTTERVLLNAMVPDGSYYTISAGSIQRVVEVY